MDIIEKLFKKVGYEKSSRIAEILGGTNLFQSSMLGLPTPENYYRYLKAYADEIWVFACVHRLATTIAGLPYKIYYKELDTKTGRLIKVDQPAHPVRKLFDKPNKNDENSTWNNMMEFIVASCELTGNTYVLQDEMVGDKPTSLQYLISSFMRIKPGTGTEFIDKYIYSKLGVSKPFEFEPEEISHFKYLSVDNYYYGQSSISPARWSVETIKEAIKTNLNIFKNGARLDGVLQTEQGLNDKIYERLENSFNQKYSGTSKAHKTPILEKGLSYKTIVGSMKDLEFIKGMRLTREEVCAVFDTPPLTVGILDRATYSNFKESMRVLYELGIIPRLRKYEPVFQEIVRKYDERAFFEYDLSDVDVLKKDHKITSEIVKNYFSVGIPVNDIISKLNLPFEPVAGGDTGYLPIALIPVGSTPEEPEGEGKTFKAAEDDRKNMLWKRFKTLTGKIEKTYMNMIEKYFTKQEKQVLGKLDKSFKAEINIESVLFNEKNEIDKWASESKKIHTVAVEENGKRELLNIGSSISFNISNPRIVKWINKYGLDKSTKVIGSLKEKIKKTMAEGVAAGEGIPKIKKRITEVYKPYKKQGYKATQMAQTEVIGASNQGALESYKQSGVVEKKGWLHGRIGEIRDWHLAAEYTFAKGIPIDEDFVLSTGARGPAPGQMGSAEEDINCHCTVIAIIDKG